MKLDANKGRAGERTQGEFVYVRYKHRSRESSFHCSTRRAAIHFSLVVVKFTIGIDSRSREDASRLERRVIALIYMLFPLIGIKLDRMTDADPATYLALCAIPANSSAFKFV